VFGFELGWVWYALDVVLAFLLIFFHHGFKTIDLVESLLAKILDLAFYVLELVSWFFVKSSSNALLLRWFLGCVYILADRGSYIIFPRKLFLVGQLTVTCSQNLISSGRGTILLQWLYWIEMSKNLWWLFIKFVCINHQGFFFHRLSLWWILIENTKLWLHLADVDPTIFFLGWYVTEITFELGCWNYGVYGCFDELFSWGKNIIFNIIIFIYFIFDCFDANLHISDIILKLRSFFPKV
jgi:hypothetical protein